MAYKVVPGFYQPTDKDKALYEGLSVCILTPCKDYENHIRFTKSLADLIAYSWMHGLKVYAFGFTERMAVQWGRNDLARTAKTKINEYTGERFTHLLWLDDDHVFTPDLLCALARHDKDMVGAMYYARAGKPLPVVYVKADTSEKYIHNPIVFPPDQLFRCDAIGFGAMLMRRDVLDRIPEPWFTLDWKGGEDIAFCVAAKENGIKVYCDGSYKLGHIGTPYIVTEQDYKRYIESNAEELKDKTKVYLGD